MQTSRVINEPMTGRKSEIFKWSHVGPSEKESLENSEILSEKRINHNATVVETGVRRGPG